MPTIRILWLGTTINDTIRPCGAPETEEPAGAEAARIEPMKWAFLLVLVVEFLLFDRMTSLHYARIYPRWNDQIQPLTESYTGYEYMRTNGFWSGIGYTLAKPSAQGDLHSLWAILVFKAAGRPSRSAALAVNMLAFLAWQAALAFAVARGGGSRVLAWMAVGLTLALRWPWSGAQGSATDFRLDQVAMCMMGISLAAALLTDGFRSTGLSSVFGVAVGITMLTRFLTGTYFIVIFGACLVWTLVSRERSRRVLNLGLAAAVAAVLVAPCFWFNRQGIYAHYWIGHYFDPDGALWDSHLSFGRASVRLWEQLCAEQLGAAFWVASGLAVLVLAGGVWFARRGPSPERAGSKNRWPKEAATLGTIFLLAPALVLPLQNQDFLVVLGAAVPGAVVLLLALCVELRTRAAGRISAGATAKLSGAAALIALAVGGGYFVARQTAAPYDADFAADARQVNALADRIFAAVRASGIAQPRVAVDRVTDYFDGTILRVICYERHQVWVPFIMELPIGLSAASESVLMDQLAISDFALATEDGPPGPWPYDRQMFALRPKILTWCDAHLRLVERFTVFGRRMALYQRRDIGMSPLFLSFPHLLCSTQGDYAYCLRVAYCPLRYHATGLPAGLELDGGSGWIRGRPIHAGTFTARITATNSVGSTACDFTFQVEDLTFFALVNAPTVCVAGAPVEVPYEAFDAGGKLDFVEVTDLTTRKLLDRLPAGSEERQNWQGRYHTTFSQPGTHMISLRFVRFDPGEKNAYTFFDKSFEISVAPAPMAAK